MANKKPLVSIVMPTYNCAAYLPESIESILAQTYDTYEVVVIDDGSADNTKLVLEPYMEKIRYIDLGRNEGLPTARNLGIQSAKGEYVAFLDADDIWMPEKLEMSIDQFMKNPDAGMVYSKHINIDSKSQFMEGKIMRRLPSGNIFTQLFFEQNFIICSSVVVRKEVFNKTALFDSELVNCQDWDMWLRIAFYYKAIGIDVPLVKYRHSSKSLSKNRDNVLKYQKVIIDKIYTMFKDSENGISEKMYKKRLAAHYAKIGRHYMRMGDKIAARENFRLSLKMDPVNIRTLRYYLFHS
ncbi:glycosyltransferase [Candidatus Kuenenia sp.]|uniref:glycosyltransferase family 2 protein n=1 Tax=Candidatus Kuenenia sp. TaxID=2499824 RepID=UPI00322031E5